MKCITLLFTTAAMLYVTQLSAQTLQAGIRSGASAWLGIGWQGPLTHQPGYTGERKDFDWDKGIYIRSEGYGQFAFDLSLNINSYKNTGSNPYLFNRNDFVVSSEHVNYDLAGTVQYCLSKRKAKLKSYLGLSINLVYNTSRYHFTYYPTYEKVNNSNNSYNYLVGLSHYLSYPITKRIFISNITGVDIDPQSSFSKQPHSPYTTRVYSRLGIGYNL